MSQCENYVRTLSCHGVRSVWGQHCDVTVMSQFEVTMSSYCDLSMRFVCDHCDVIVTSNCWLGTVIQSYHGGDMRWEGETQAYTSTYTRDPYPPTPYRRGMRGTGLWWCCKLYTVGKWIAAHLSVMAMTRIRTPVPRVTYFALYLTELTPHPLNALEAAGTALPRARR